MRRCCRRPARKRFLDSIPELLKATMRRKQSPSFGQGMRAFWPAQSKMLGEKVIGCFASEKLIGALRSFIEAEAPGADGKDPVADTVTFDGLGPRIGGGRTWTDSKSGDNRSMKYAQLVRILFARRFNPLHWDLKSTARAECESILRCQL